MAVVTVTIELSFVTDATSGKVIADLLKQKQAAGEGTMISDNFGVYDYEPDEKIINVEVK